MKNSKMEVFVVCVAEVGCFMPAAYRLFIVKAVSFISCPEAEGIALFIW